MNIDFDKLNSLYRNNLEAKGTLIKDESETAQKYRRKLNGKTLSQIDQEFWEYILELLNTASEYSQQEKNEIVEDIAEYYYLQTGNPIRNEMLTALGDFLLDITLADKSPNKTKKEAYPVLSFRQLEKRYRREVGVDVEVLDYFHTLKSSNNKKNTSEHSENS